MDRAQGLGSAHGLLVVDWFICWMLNVVPAGGWRMWAQDLVCCFWVFDSESLEFLKMRSIKMATSAHCHKDCLPPAKPCCLSQIRLQCRFVRRHNDNIWTALYTVSVSSS